MKNSRGVSLSELVSKRLLSEPSERNKTCMKPLTDPFTGKFPKYLCTLLTANSEIQTYHNPITADGSK